MSQFLPFFLLCISLWYGSTSYTAIRDPRTYRLYKPAIKQVVIWGHKLHTHTHSYIHNAFERAFGHIGYKTLWLDNNDRIEGIDFSSTLFLTEGQVDQKIPIRNDCWYILHNCDMQKYASVPQDNILCLQVYTHKCKKNSLKIEEYIYYNPSEKMLYMPWATDLLPHEIDEVKKQIPHIQRSRSVWYVGTIGGNIFGNINEMMGFAKASRQHGFTFENKIQKLSISENIRCVAQAAFAPAIVGTWQKEQGYIPCRIFKNISYGNWGITNSQAVYELFNKKIIFNENTYELFFDALVYIHNAPLEELYDLMDFVRDHHTYLNRIAYLLQFLKV